jgi:MinD-like ATPase involved in chromosome partitioning or flagellar assembly
MSTSATPARHTEVIVFCSGKGGTGKTSLISALGYALRWSGHRVLFIDADRATDGLSLYVLGPQGRDQLVSFAPESTFTGLLDRFDRTGEMDPRPHTVHRTQDHGVSYDVVISDRYLYGDAPRSERPTGSSIDRQFERGKFQQAVQGLFERIRASGDYDYVLVDSRGGFSFESTDVAAAGDSFVVVTEATYTNFYQDRNLVDRISEAAESMGRQSVLRGVIVNKSTDPGELSYRNELVREFGIRFEDTYSVAIDLEALRAYKEQKSVFREAPASLFAYDALQAFQRILRVVTSQWPVERVARWDELIGTIDAAIGRHNAQMDTLKAAAEAEKARMGETEAERERLKAELERERVAHAQEQKRQDILVEELRGQERRREERFARDLEEARQRAAHEAESTRQYDLLKAGHEAERRLATARSLARTSWLVSAALALLTLFACWIAWAGRAATAPAPYAASAPGAGAGDLATAALPAPASASAPTPVRVPADPGAVEPARTAQTWMRPCAKGSYNVIVASGFGDVDAADRRRRTLEHTYPDYQFKVALSVSGDRAGNAMPAVFAGQGLTRVDAAELLRQLKELDVGAGDAYVTRQGFDCRGPAPAAARSRAGAQQASPY